MGKGLNIDNKIRMTQAAGSSALNGDPTQFRLSAEAHRIRLAFQYDPHFAVSVSQIDPLPHQLDALKVIPDHEGADPEVNHGDPAP
jgi:hypothetical protein